jgi:hypothetical protein
MRPAPSRLLTALASVLLAGACTDEHSPLVPKASESPPPGCLPTCPLLIPLIYVANQNNITAYEDGHSSPYNTIAGSKTGISDPFGIALDGSGNIYIGDKAAIDVFGANAIGNVSPKAIITGSNTGLKNVAGLALDAAGNMYASTGSAIRVFAAGATGNARPKAVIAGSNTGFGAAGAGNVSVDGSGSIYVSLPGSNAIEIFAPGATGNVSPVATISGAKTHLAYPGQVAFDGSGKLYVPNRVPVAGSDTGSVTVYAAGATGDVSPVATIQGTKTGFLDPTGVTLGNGGNLYVANSDQGASSSITVYAPGANGNVSPIETIQTGSANPSAIAFYEKLVVF